MEQQQTHADIRRKKPTSAHIVFNNGILNLNNGMFLPHSTEFFITNMVKADWTNNETYCPYFDSLISKYTGGDPILANRLLEALGLCLTNDTIKRIICFLGVTNSGKSTLVRFILSLLNENAVVTMQPNDFEERFALSKIYEKSLIACMDMEARPLEIIMAKLREETNAIVKKLVMAYLRLRNNNYVFSGTGAYYDTYTPPSGVLRTAEECFKEFLQTHCIISASDNDFIFTDEMFNAYQSYALSYRKTPFKNLDSFSKCIRNTLNLKRTKKRRKGNINPISCYLGIRFRGWEGDCE